MSYGTLNTDIVQSSTAGTPPAFYDGNSTQIGTLCRAWVSFNSTSGACVVRGSFNVSSVTYYSTGNYGVNFATAMPNANYCVNMTGTIGGSGAIAGVNTDSYTRTTSLIRMYTSSYANAAINCQDVNVSVFD